MTTRHDGLAHVLALFCLITPALLACSTSSTPTGGTEFKLGFQDGQEVAEDQESTRAERNQIERARTKQRDEEAAGQPATTSTGSPEPTTRTIDDHALGAIEGPSRAHLEYVKKQGLPLPTPSQRTAGPFEGPEQSLVYLDHEGHVTIYIPSFHTVYFAQLEANQFKWLYGASLQGYFMFDQSNDYVGLSEPPEKLVKWPMAVESAQHVASFAASYVEAEERQKQEGTPMNARMAAHRDLDTLSPGERSSFWDKMHTMSEAFTALSAQRVASIGGQGCVAHYPYSYYIGCY